MKMLVLVTDSEYEPHCMTMMREKGLAGYTIIPDVLGAGRSGLKLGDRVHPGASVVLLAAIGDEVAPGILECIATCKRENKLCESTHAWVLPVEASL